MKKLLLVVPMALMLVGCGNSDKKERKLNAALRAEEIFSAGKQVLLEKSTNQFFDMIDYVTEQGDIYIVTCKDLFANGDVDGKNPFKTEASDGGMTITLNSSTNQFDVTVTGTIDGFAIIYDSYSQSFSAK